MTCMISEGKICIHLARDSDLAYTTEEDLLKISTNFFFVTDKGLVEIISYTLQKMKKMKEQRTQFSSQIVFRENYVFENAKFFWLWLSYNFDLRKQKKMSTKFQ